MSDTRQHRQGRPSRPAKRYVPQGRHQATLRRAMASMDDTLDTSELSSSWRTR